MGARLYIKREIGNKTIEDKSNLDEYEKSYIDEANTEIFNNVCKKMFDMDYVSLAAELGLETKEEATKFGKDLGRAIRGETPR